MSQRFEYMGTYSDACLLSGDGQCDGFVPEDEVHANDFCDCGCHVIWEPLESAEEYVEWHYEFWS